MSTVTVTIAKVETAVGTGKTGSPWKRYDVFDQNGVKYVTFRAPVGEAAMTHVGRPVDIDVSQKAREGRPPDNILDAVRPAAQQTVVPPPASSAPSVPAPAPASAVPPPPTAGGMGPVSKDTSIVRQVAWKAAAVLFQGTGNFTQALTTAAAIEAHILRAPEAPFGAGGGPEDDIPFMPEVA